MHRNSDHNVKSTTNRGTRVKMENTDPCDSKLIRLSQLCKSCQGINITAMQSNDGYLHSSSISNLDTSASSCPMCKLMLFAIRRENFPEMDLSLQASLTTELANLLLTRGVASFEKCPLYLQYRTSFESEAHIDGFLAILLQRERGGDRSTCIRIGVLRLHRDPGTKCCFLGCL